MTYHLLQHEIDSLCGNVNRIYVADTSQEQIKQKDWCIRRTNTLFEHIETEHTYETWILHQISKALYTDESPTIKSITSRIDAINRIDEIFEQNKNKFTKKENHNCYQINRKT